MADGPVRGGRFSQPLASIAARLNASHAFDRRLAPFDVAQSQAHVRMLAARGFVSAEESAQLIKGLTQVGGEIDEGKLTWRDDLEDVHMHVESRLREICGDVAGKLQTGRSRNDQVVTDLRLYARDAAARLANRVQQLRRSLLKQAKQHLDVLAPGYTHTQRAQPVRLSHHLLAHAEALGRDAVRFGQSRVAADVSPLGSGALAATSIPIDREQTAQELGFASLSRNSLDAVGDRDFAMGLVYCAAVCMTHLSRLAEEIVLWSTTEFGFVDPPEAYCSGSSLMPQKVNPDVAELVRAKVGRVVGDLVNLFMITKALPLAYNKDLQETQEPLYDAVETLDLALEAMTGLVSGLQFRIDRLNQAAGDPLLRATDMAESLVRQGATFRDAHSEVGRRVRERDLSEALSAEAAVEARDVVGGPARARVEAEIQRIEKEIAEAERAVAKAK